MNYLRAKLLLFFHCLFRMHRSFSWTDGVSNEFGCHDCDKTYYSTREKLP